MTAVLCRHTVRRATCDDSTRLQVAQRTRRSCGLARPVSEPRRRSALARGSVEFTVALLASRRGGRHAGRRRALRRTAATAEVSIYLLLDRHGEGLGRNCCGSAAVAYGASSTDQDTAGRDAAGTPRRSDCSSAAVTRGTPSGIPRGSAPHERRRGHRHWRSRGRP